MGQYSKYSQVLKETQNTPLKLHNPHRMTFNSMKFTDMCLLDIVVAEDVMCTLLSWSDTIKKEKGISVQSVLKSE